MLDDATTGPETDSFLNSNTKISLPSVRESSVRSIVTDVVELDITVVPLNWPPVISPEVIPVPDNVQ